MKVHHDVQTLHCRIAVEVKGRGFPVVFVHGNSACRHVFRKQTASPLLEGYRLITFDLPGHGDSADATEPSRTYALPGLCDLLQELLVELDVDEAAIVGASLGGHIAIELLARSTIPRGVFLMGAPAVGPDMAEGFVENPMYGLFSQSKLSMEETERFARAVFGANVEPFMQTAIEQTDTNFRSTLFAAARRHVGVNQRNALALTHVPTAIVNGEFDSMVNLDYVDRVPYAKLWRGKCFRMPNSSHSPYWDAPERVNLLLSDFLKDLSGEAK